MKKLEDSQIEFIINHFFKHDEYSGWHNIATALLDHGYCFVPGTKCVWQGGIGNFIKVEEFPELIDCVKYTFYLEEFLSSLWLNDVVYQHLYVLRKELVEAQQKVDEWINDWSEIVTHKNLQIKK